MAGFRHRDALPQVFMETLLGEGCLQGGSTWLRGKEMRLIRRAQNHVLVGMKTISNRVHRGVDSQGDVPCSSPRSSTLTPVKLTSGAAAALGSTEAGRATLLVARGGLMFSVSLSQEFQSVTLGQGAMHIEV